MAELRKARAIYVCQECGSESVRWQGRCPDCNAWNTFVEKVQRPVRNAAPSRPPLVALAPIQVSDLSRELRPRLELGSPEFDRVLGEGVVAGSLVLIGGDPGIGKSTLLLQAAAAVAAAGKRVLYVSGEESAHQLKLRANRLSISGERLYLLVETDIDEALTSAESLQPDLLIVDSIQTVFSPELPNAPGTVVQLRESTQRIMRWAKASNVPAFIVGHVTKEGEIAGPRLLEHLVDVVLYLEGDRFSSYRLLRGVKNRFGATSEVGVFEMLGSGMEPVENPSEIFLAERARGAVGSVIVPVIEGTRSMLVELQALTTPTSLSIPRRTAHGIELNRLLLIGAVLSKRARIELYNQDVIVNIVGGLRVQEPAADLGLALAIASSYKDRRLPGDLIAIGEVGLSGELRSVSHIGRRLAEAEKMGFVHALIPAAALRRQRPQTALQLHPVSTLLEAVGTAFAMEPGPILDSASGA